MKKKIGLITSGGDAPGMNASTRAIVRKAVSKGYVIEAFRGGFDGILKEKVMPMNRRSVSNIIQEGGTVIKTARSKAFYEDENVQKAANILDENDFDGLIANGGNGTMKGLKALSKHWNGQIIGLPGTIDNDIYGTDFTIGFDTAVNTALDAIDKI
ncbi:MAG: 6-phosphofructokinase, partial [Candidatus Hodarchaeales archaeon]